MAPCGSLDGALLRACAASRTTPPGAKCAASRTKWTEREHAIARAHNPCPSRVAGRRENRSAVPNCKRWSHSMRSARLTRATATQICGGTARAPATTTTTASFSWTRKRRRVPRGSNPEARRRRRLAELSRRRRRRRRQRVVPQDVRLEAHLHGRIVQVHRLPFLRRRRVFVPQDVRLEARERDEHRLLSADRAAALRDAPRGSGACRYLLVVQP